MPRNIILAASLPAAPDRLFDMYLDPESHSAFTGTPVTIGAKAGALFQAFNGALSGTIPCRAEAAHRADVAIHAFSAGKHGLGARALVSSRP